MFLLNIIISTLDYCRKQGNPENIFPNIIADLILVLIYDDWTFMPMICDLDSTHLRWISIDFILQIVLSFPSLMPFRYNMNIIQSTHIHRIWFWYTFNNYCFISYFYEMKYDNNRMNVLNLEYNACICLQQQNLASIVYSNLSAQLQLSFCR